MEPSKSEEVRWLKQRPSITGITFNITVTQVYVPPSEFDDSEVDHIYQRFQDVIGQTPKKDLMIVQKRLEWVHRQTGDTFVDPTAIPRQMKEASNFYGLQSLTT